MRWSGSSYLGVAGKKVEVYLLPHSRIDMWSSENAGTLDWNSELEMWTRAGHIKVRLGKGIDCADSTM